MADPKTIHIWMPDRRSLCDRRAQPRFSNSDTQEQVLADLKMASVAPVCGACAIVMFELRWQMAVLSQQQPQFWPPTVKKAAASLKGTRWEFTRAFSRLAGATGELVELAESPLTEEHLLIEAKRRREAEIAEIEELEAEIKKKEEAPDGSGS